MECEIACQFLPEENLSGETMPDKVQAGQFWNRTSSYYDTFALQMRLSGIIMLPINTHNASFMVKESPYGAVNGTNNTSIVSLNDANS